MTIFLCVTNLVHPIIEFVGSLTFNHVNTDVWLVNEIFLSADHSAIYVATDIVTYSHLNKHRRETNENSLDWAAVNRSQGWCRSPWFRLSSVTDRIAACRPWLPRLRNYRVQSRRWRCMIPRLTVVAFKFYFMRRDADRNGDHVFPTRLHTLYDPSSHIAPLCCTLCIHTKNAWVNAYVTK